MIKKIFNYSFCNKKKKYGVENMTENTKDYFQLATSWADDYYARMIVSRNRYQMAFIVAMVLCGLLAVSTMMLSHTHEYIPLLVHHYESGAVSVEPSKNNYVPRNKAEIESDLVRYVINRESYDPASFAEMYQIISLMSDSHVAHLYQAEQDANDNQSFIHKFGNKATLSVKVISVSFLDNEDLNTQDKHEHHKNLAEVHFIVTNKSLNSGKEEKMPYIAILSWQYGGIPSDPELRWLNWNGFMVTSYQRNQQILA